MTALPPAPLDGARELFALDPSVTHLNHGSFGAVPEAVRLARRAFMDEHDANPTRFITDGLWPRIARARQALAEFSGVDPARAALVVNATTGTAMVLHSLDLRAGDEVVVTDHGYNAVTMALHELAALRGVRVVTVPVELGSSDADTVAAVLSRVAERTRLVIVDQVSSATAQRHPVAAIARALRETGVPLHVDGAHAPGMIPRAAEKIDADFWVGNLHKWAYAPGGTALLRVSPDRLGRMRPLAASHALTGGFPGSLEEQGSRDYSPWLAAPTGLDLFARYGEDTVQRHNTELAAYGQRVLGAALGLDDAELPDPGDGVSMRLIPLPDGLVREEAQASALRLRISGELATEVNVTTWRDRAFIRISGQVYNDAGELDRLAERLPAFLRSLTRAAGAA